MSHLLYYHPQSNFSRKIRILLTEKQINFELGKIDLRSKPEHFLKLSPIGKVPVFVDEDGTVIWDSSLIAEYLEEKYPEPSFCPKPFQERFACLKWEELADILGEHIINLWAQGLWNPGEETKYKSLLRQKIARLILVFEEQLSQTDYLLGGDTWSLADISALCSFGYYDLRLGENWRTAYPHIASWFNKLHQINSVQSTVPPSTP
ncbi:MAG: glutathione S-transferase family protein [Cyanobacteria bacterium SW_9_44_58]|nr:MAG: glutathione S-transferase family protein [Cyanobacteria bacterium SW_9_44_58]